MTTARIRPHGANGAAGAKKRARTVPAARGEGRQAARKHLELLTGPLGWTSVEREQKMAALDTAYAGNEAARAAFSDRLLAWSRTALEARPGAIESPRLSLLTSLGELVRRSVATNEILTQALERVHRAVAYESATFFLFDKAQGSLVRAAAAGGHVDLIPDVQFDLGQGLSSWVAGSQRPVLLSELRGEGRTDEPGTRPGSFLSVPLVVQKELVGVLNVGHSQPGAFTEADRDLLVSAAAILAAPLVRHAAHEEIRLRSGVDELTGLLNRIQFEARVAQEIEKSRRYGETFAIALIDPDRFRALNQTFGRPFGDACLVEYAQLLKEHARQSDLLARLAPGDEFALLLPHQSAEAAAQAAARLKEALDGHVFPRRRRLSVSIGVVAYPDDGAEQTALLSNARLALSRAKTGDGQVTSEVV